MQLNRLPNILAFCFILILFSSCNDRTSNEPFGTSVFSTMSEEEKVYSTRTSVKYKEEVLVRFTVIYDGDFTKMTTNDSPLQALLETYNLKIKDPFELDKENKGLILVPAIPLTAPIEVGKELSLIDEVLMVEVVRVPTKKIDHS
jgi:hypothetical protein